MIFGIFQRSSATLSILAICLGCTHQNPQDLKEKTAHATAELKRDAKAVASGIHEGWSQYKIQDVNTATKEQLLSLPGVSPAEADRIIAARPYDRPEDLVTRRMWPMHRRWTNTQFAQDATTWNFPKVRSTWNVISLSCCFSNSSTREFSYRTGSAVKSALDTFLP